MAHLQRPPKRRFPPNWENRIPTWFRPGARAEVRGVSVLDRVQNGWVWQDASGRRRGLRNGSERSLRKEAFRSCFHSFPAARPGFRRGSGRTLRGAGIDRNRPERGDRNWDRGEARSTGSGCSGPRDPRRTGERNPEVQGENSDTPARKQRSGAGGAGIIKQRGRNRDRKERFRFPWPGFHRALVEVPHEKSRVAHFRPEWGGKTGTFSTGIYSIIPGQVEDFLSGYLGMPLSLLEGNHHRGNLYGRGGVRLFRIRRLVRR